MDKKLMRQKYLQYLKEIPTNKRNEMEASIIYHVTEQSNWRNAKIIALTVPNYPEVNITPLIEKAWEQGKTVAIPKCYPKDRTMTFHQFTSFQQLETVYFGIKEPMIEVCKEIKLNKLDYMLVPGLAFNKQGYRLGFGGGYYDRILEHFQGETVSVAFSGQVSNEIIVEKHDKAVKQIITERGLLTLE